MRTPRPDIVGLHEIDFVIDTIPLGPSRLYFRVAAGPKTRIAQYPTVCATCGKTATFATFNANGDPYFYCRTHFRHLEDRYARWRWHGNPAR